MVGSVQILPLYLDSSCWETSSSSPLLNWPPCVFSGRRRRSEEEERAINEFIPAIDGEGGRQIPTDLWNVFTTAAGGGGDEEEEGKKKEGRDERRKKWEWSGGATHGSSFFSCQPFNCFLAVVTMTAALRRRGGVAIARLCALTPRRRDSAAAGGATVKMTLRYTQSLYSHLPRLCVAACLKGNNNHMGWRIFFLFYFFYIEAVGIDRTVWFIICVKFDGLKVKFLSLFFLSFFY